MFPETELLRFGDGIWYTFDNRHYGQKVGQRA